MKACFTLGMSMMMLIAVLLLMPFSSAFVFEVTHNCTTSDCITGTPATWNVSISNEGGRFQEIIGVDIVDAVSQDVSASFRTTFYPQQEERGSVILLNARNEITIPVTGEVPAPNSIDNSFWYYPCFVTVIREPLEVARQGKYERSHCFSQNFTMPAHHCISSIHCKAEEFCEENQCKRLECPDCNYISNHTCVAHQCCVSDHCATNQFCANNTCQNIFCSPTQYLFNRTCVDLNCGPDEHIEDKQCKKLDCAYNEFASNHTCQPLSCTGEEFMAEHQCITLDCAYNEYPANHTCLPLLCKEDEGYVDHQCSSLDCWFFQDPISHTCKTNWLLVGKLLLELIVLALIVWFLIKDYQKHKQRATEATHKKTTESTQP